MKKLLILLLTLPILASAQSWTNFNAFGLQRKVSLGDTTWRFVGSGGNGTLSFNPSGGGGVNSIISSNGDITLTGTTDRVMTLNSGIGANKIPKRDASGNIVVGSTTELLIPVSNGIQYKSGSTSSNGSHSFYVNGLVATINVNGLSTNNVFVNADTYGIGWAGSTAVPTKADLYGKIQTLQPAITLTTMGTSGAATLIGNTLNIPQYAGGGGGGSGTVNTGTANRLSYYASTGTAVSELSAITANRVLLSDANGLPTASSVTNTTLSYLDATSSIQTQFNGLSSTYQTLANLTTSTSLGTSNTLYPSQNAVKSYVDAAVSGGGVGSSGTYTPTVSDAINCSSFTVSPAHYIRVGNQVTVYGRIQMTVSASSSVSLNLSLPVASNIATYSDASGYGSVDNAGSTNNYIAIGGDGVSDDVIVGFTSGTNTAVSLMYSFTYTVI